MTTNFNLVIDTESNFNAKDFSKVCVKMRDALKLYEQTEKIYNFLKLRKGCEFSPTEIGFGLGEPFITHFAWCNSDEACVKMISDSLYWLLQMGLVKYNSYVEKVDIELPYPEKVKDVKIIDGVEYVGYVTKKTRTVNSESRKWFAL